MSCLKVLVSVLLPYTICERTYSEVLRETNISVVGYEDDHIFHASSGFK